MPEQRVLIIDDEENMRHMLKVMLDKAGYRAEGAVDGIDALEQMEKTCFDFVLCDIKMPPNGWNDLLEKRQRKISGQDIYHDVRFRQY